MSSEAYYKEMVRIKREIRRLEEKKEEVRSNPEMSDQTKQHLIISYINDIANLMNMRDRWKIYP